MKSELTLLIDLARLQAVMTRRLDAGLGGLGLQEFIILHHLDQAKDKKMRRIDLAEKIGFTPSGITRLLAPMEKIGLVKREKYAADARVSYVMLAAGGKRKLDEAMDRAEEFVGEWLPTGCIKDLPALTAALKEVHGRIR